MSMEEAPCFTIQDLTFQYPDKPGAPGACVFTDLTIQIPRGAVTAMVGLSGSGKSTLLNVLGLLANPDEIKSGTILYQGRDVGKMTSDQRSELRRTEFGFVLQNAFLLPHFSCVDNVAMPLALAGEDYESRREKARALMQKVGLKPELADRAAADVSGGERQRLAALRAMIHQPAVLFADEPLNNLDFRSAAQMLRLLLEEDRSPQSLTDDSAKRTMVIVSHGLKGFYKKIDWFVVMHRGRIVRGRALSFQEMEELGGLRALRKMIAHGEIHDRQI